MIIYRKNVIFINFLLKIILLMKLKKVAVVVYDIASKYKYDDIANI